MNLVIKRAVVLTVLIVTTAMLVLPSLGGNISAASISGKPAPGYNLYFGDLHSHTGYSDGYGTPEQAYAAAKAGGADFFATTDHTKWISPSQWIATKQAAANATSKTFVAIPATEYWLEGNLGELNVYGDSDLPPIYTTFGNKQVRLQNFYDWLSAQPGVSAQWNHPNYMTQTVYNDFGYYSASRDRALNLFEIHNYGSWLWQGTLDFESYFITALDNGWHVMPTASSDTHATNWISGYEPRTVLLAPSLTASDLYAAMGACRGYATLDQNLRVSYSVNGMVMGSILSSTATSFTATIHVEDPDGVATDAITLVEVVADGGKVVASMPGSGTTFDWTVTLDSQGAHYFYLRISTASNVSGGPGVTAWTAPIWTGL